MAIWLYLLFALDTIVLGVGDNLYDLCLSKNKKGCVTVVLTVFAKQTATELLNARPT